MSRELLIKNENNLFIEHHCRKYRSDSLVFVLFCLNYDSCGFPNINCCAILTVFHDKTADFLRYH